MSTFPVKIFLSGATGYIGGAVLQKLLDHPDASSFDITLLVRSPEKAKGFEKNGVKAVVGSFGDEDKVEQLSSEADYVFAIADADNLEATKAVLRGLKRYHEKTGKVPVLIHTSGTGVLTDDAAGMYSYDTIWNDADPDQIESLPDTQLHRNVDLTILQADKEGYIKSHIILPSTIYGLGSGKLVDQGLVNPHSIQIPELIRAGIDRGQAGIVGEGKNLWPNVYIQDVAELYIVLFDAIRQGRNPGHGREGFYFGENGEHRLYDIGKRIAVALSKRGIGKDEPTSFTQAEANKYFGGNYPGSNSRCRGNRSRAIGWKPTKTTEDMLDSIEPEVEAILSKQK